MSIKFYRTNEKYGAFSNFSRHPVLMGGKIYPTSEHFFQSQKFVGTPHEEEVRLAANPSTAAAMGRDRSRPLRKDWEMVKELAFWREVHKNEPMDEREFKLEEKIRKLANPDQYGRRRYNGIDNED